jgi:hypothetical protein
VEGQLPESRLFRTWPGHIELPARRLCRDIKLHPGHPKTCSTPLR